MTQKNEANTYKIKNDYVYESCYICGRGIVNINRIWVDLKTDNYICPSCKKIHNIKAVKCDDL